MKSAYCFVSRSAIYQSLALTIATSAMLLCSCSKQTASRDNNGVPIMHEELLVLDVGPSSDLRIDGVSISFEIFSKIIDRRNEPGLILQIRAARDLPLSDLLAIVDLAKQKGISEFRLLLTKLTIDQLTKPYVTNDFIVVD
jgi:hypothetical protein